MTSSSSSSSRQEERSEEEAPKFIQTLSPVEVTEGDPLILSCSLTGKPEPNVEWFFNGQLLSSDDVVTISYRNGKCQLEIKETLIDDEGDYICKASNTAGVASTKANVVVKAAKKQIATSVEKKVDVEAPRFLEHLQGQSVFDGDQVTLQCRISGKPEVTWSCNGRDITDSDDFKYQNAGDIFKLVIGEIYPEDGGVYTCTATNAAGMASSSATVFVAVPDEEPTAPVFQEFPRSQNVEEGSPVTLSCTLNSSAPVTVTWSKDGRQLEDTGRFSFHQDGNTFTLTIPAALATDTGIYCVTATSELGSASWSSSLGVAIGEASGGDEARLQELLKSVE